MGASRTVCAVYDCKNAEYKTKDISYHRFPDKLKRPDLYKKWLTVGGKKNWNPSRHSVICSEHFESKDFKRQKPRRVLEDDAVPYNFYACRVYLKSSKPPNPKPVSNSSVASTRPVRVSARRQKKAIEKSSPINDPDFPLAPVQPSPHFQFPVQTFVEESRTKIRGCSAVILQAFPWSHYDAEKDKVFCFKCVTAIRERWMKKVDDVFVLEGFNLWLDLSKALRKHGKSELHGQAAEILNQKGFDIPSPIVLQPTTCKIEPGETSSTGTPWHDPLERIYTLAQQAKRISRCQAKLQVSIARHDDPALLYLISLVKDKQALYDPSHEYYSSNRPFLSPTEIECWLEIATDMVEAGFKQFDDFQVCRLVYNKIHLSFCRARIKYIQRLLDAAIPSLVFPPRPAIYSRMLWNVPYIKSNQILKLQSQYEMTEMDRRQIEDPALKFQLDCSVLHQADEDETHLTESVAAEDTDDADYDDKESYEPESKKVKKEIEKIDSGIQTMDIDLDIAIEIIGRQLLLLGPSQKDEYLLRIQKFYAKVLYE